MLITVIIEWKNYTRYWENYHSFAILHISSIKNNLSFYIFKCFNFMFMLKLIFVLFTGNHCQSVRDDSFFADNRLPQKQLICYVYYWSHNMVFHLFFWLLTIAPGSPTWSFVINPLSILPVLWLQHTIWICSPLSVFYQQQIWYIQCRGLVMPKANSLIVCL